MAKTVNERFWEKVEPNGIDCWIWTAYIAKHGSGKFRVDGKSIDAHRFAYKLLIGPIPEGKELDHLCRVRHCVNPDHLEPVTHKENMQRGANTNRDNRCQRGHIFDRINKNSGKRYCSTCRAEYDKKYWQKRKARGG